MENKEANKNRLRDKTCDNCFYNVNGFCKRDDMKFLLPEENTCSNWKELVSKIVFENYTWKLRA